MEKKIKLGFVGLGLRGSDILENVVMPFCEEDVEVIAVCDVCQDRAEKGAEIVMQILDGVNDVKFVEIARNIAHYHHEKWNGQGYPEKLSGIDIPLEARIMALADVFDALVSKRCYKEKMDYDRAFIIIEESLGSHFDPELGKMFIKCREQLEKYYDEMEN